MHRLWINNITDAKYEERNTHCNNNIALSEMGQISKVLVLPNIDHIFVNLMISNDFLSHLAGTLVKLQQTVTF